MPSLPNLQFGSGLLFCTPQAGNLAVDPTPIPVGVIQDVKFTMAGDIKSLFGQNQFPVDSAIGKRSLKGSFNFAQYSISFFNQMFFGDTTSTGVIDVVTGEADTIPASTPYTVTVSNSAHFAMDLGVTYTTGPNASAPLVKLATGTPATGQYVVNATTGVYTFAAADEGLGILIAYTWTNTTFGATLTAANHTMGWGPVLSMNIVFPYEGTGGSTPNGIYLSNVRLGKIDFTTKLDDYMMMSTDFEAFAGSGNNPITIYGAY